MSAGQCSGSSYLHPIAILGTQEGGKLQGFIHSPIISQQMVPFGLKHDNIIQLWVIFTGLMVA